jgi:MFS family permease
VLIFPVLGNSLSFLVLSAVFGFGFAGNMTSLSLCVRDAVPANRFGGALGAVMMIAWAGMASSSYFSGRMFDITLSYNLSFVVAGITGTLNLVVLALISFRQRRFAFVHRLSIAQGGHGSASPTKAAGRTADRPKRPP